MVTDAYNRLLIEDLAREGASPADLLRLLVTARAGLGDYLSNVGATDPRKRALFDPTSLSYVDSLFLRFQEMSDLIAQLEAGNVSFIGDLIGGIGDVIKKIPTVVQQIPGVIQQAVPIIGAVGDVVQAIRSATGTPVEMMAQGPSWINPQTGLPYTQQEVEFIAACNANPSGCAQLIAQNTFGLGGGGMTMPINPTTGSPMMLEAGIAGGLGALARQALMNPSVQAGLRALGFGALIGAGEAGVNALVGGAASALTAGGSAAGVSGPLLMNWPAATSYPRGIVLRAPDKPEKRYRSEGAALLRSGDVAAVRRVQKAATRARRGRRRGAAPRQVLVLPNGQHHVCGSCLSSPCSCK